MFSVGFPAWILGHDPTKRIICVSYNQDFANKLSRDTRRIMESDWYKELFPDCRLIPGRQRDSELTTTRGGGRFASGIGGGPLGRGADIIIIDDPIKPLDALSAAERQRVIDFYTNTLITRLNDKQRGVIIIVMQRLHEDDLVGHVLSQDDWEVVALPAIATDDLTYQLSDDPDDVFHRLAGSVLHGAREPMSVLDGLRRQLGSLTFQAQYQQDPTPAEGNIIRREWLRFYADEERPEHCDRVIASWDTASTIGEASDYSVGTIWGAVGSDYYLLDVERCRLRVPDLRRSIVALSEHWRVSATIIEDTELGRAVRDDLQQTGELRAILRPARFDKEARLLAQSARFESGQVHLPSDAEWLGDYVNELLAFPNGRHDDQVDSTSQALRYLTSRASNERPLTRRTLHRRNIIRAHS